jgi:cytochrome c oxidase subunit IV
MSALVGLSKRGYSMTLLLSLVAATCAVIVAVVFVMAWRDEDVLVTVMLGVVLLSLLLVAMVALRESI